LGVSLFNIFAIKRYRRIFGMKLQLISESKIVAAIAVIKSNGKFLLGLSTASDARKNTWCFPGGHLKRGESPEKAAVREAKEEAKIHCRVAKGPVFASGLPSIAFFLCKASTPKDPHPNREFSNMGWFTPQEMRGLKLYKNVKEILRKFDEIS
jgi:8-oxo-dGTP diphosphatase